MENEHRSKPSFEDNVEPISRETSKPGEKKQNNNSSSSKLDSPKRGIKSVENVPLIEASMSSSSSSSS